MNSPWNIFLFGGLRIRQAEHTITRFRTQKTASLLAYLAYHLRQVHSRETLREIGIADDVSHQVVRLAKIGVDCGIGGVVASAREIGALRKAIDRNVKLVIPGIRPLGSEEHDQKRTMTPAQAVAAGADYLVVGRPITSGSDPTIAAKQILEEIESAL